VSPAGPQTFPTSTPLTDAELGSVGDLPWDGVPGPRRLPDGGGALYDFADFDHVDYVASALAGRFTLALTGAVSTREYEARILSVARAYQALGAGALGAGHRRWWLLSFNSLDQTDADAQAAQAATGVAVVAPAYRLRWGTGAQHSQPTDDPRRTGVQFDHRVDMMVGAGPVALIDEGAGWRAVSTS
jgi:hypothetical protein